MKEINADITQVLVYRSGARVVRTGKTELPKGEQVVKIAGISQYAQTDSFRVKGKGKALLRGVEVKRVRKESEPEGNLGELTKKLRTLEKKRANIEDSLRLHEKRIEGLNSISTQFGEEFGKWFAVGETPMEVYTEMDSSLVAIVRSVHDTLRRLNKELEEVNTEISVIESNIERVRSTQRVVPVFDAYLSLDVKESSPIEIELSYQVIGASWEPVYDVDIGAGKTTVKRIAQVYNTTFEDWKDVSLTISTASARKVEAIEPSPYYIDIYRPEPMPPPAPLAVRPKAMREDKEAEMEIMDEYIDETAEIEQVYATPTETLGGTTVYEITGTVSVESTGEPQPVTLTLEEFDSRRLYFWNATDMAAVVAQDEITNGDSVLLPGNVKVYAAGDFIGETYTDLIAPREKFRLGTRAAYDVKAEKKLILKDTEKAGLTRGKQRREYVYTLLVTSFSKEDIDIKVVDRIPYSESEKVSVETTEVNPQPKKVELGILEWEMTIPAGEKTEITYRYEVEWEKGLRIRPPLP